MTYTIIGFLLIGLIIGIGLYFLYKFQLSKLQKINFYVSSFLNKKNQTYFYIVYEPKKGFFLKARTLAKKHPYLIPTKAASLLSKKYKNEDEAKKALEKFETLFKNKS